MSDLRHTPKRRNRQAGLTLVEMMISVLIVSIAISAALTLGYTMMNSYRDQRRMALVERGARVSLAILSRSIRNASPGVPSGNVGDAVGCTSTGGIRVINSSVGPDQLEIIHASGGVLTSMRDDVPFTETDTALIVLNGAGFKAGDYALISNLDQGHLVAVTAVAQTGATWTLTTKAASGCGPAFPGGGYKPGALVMRAKIERFFVSTGPEVAGVPTLMVDPDGNGPLTPEPVAAGVEDMQVSVGVDANSDGTVVENGTSTDEWHYNNAADVAPPLPTATPWRALRITLVARSVEENTAKPTSTRPPLEDRTGAFAADQFRRRVLSATIEVRNHIGSP